MSLTSLSSKKLSISNHSCFFPAQLVAFSSKHFLGDPNCREPWHWGAKSRGLSEGARRPNLRWSNVWSEGAWGSEMRESSIWYEGARGPKLRWSNIWSKWARGPKLRGSAVWQDVISIIKFWFHFFVLRMGMGLIHTDITGLLFNPFITSFHLITCSSTTGTRTCLTGCRTGLSSHRTGLTGLSGDN